MLDREQIRERMELWKKEDDKIVFTNGCFDLLHIGHIRYLSEARDLGDKLVIGLNSDASVRQLKGPHRPIQDEYSRQILLAALSCVDAVVLFEEETPLELIKTILPDVLVKGGDWDISRIVGAEIVLANGGIVCSLPYSAGRSTTQIEQRIIELHSI